jgi:hypothetical protein
MISFQMVHLDGNRAFGDRGIAAVAGALAENCCNVKLLDVSHCGLTDNGAASLGYLLEFNGTLTSLWAAHNRFSGAAGAKALMEGLRENTTLLVSRGAGPPFKKTSTTVCSPYNKA